MPATPTRRVRSRPITARWCGLRARKPRGRRRPSSIAIRATRPKSPRPSARSCLPNNRHLQFNFLEFAASSRRERDIRRPRYGTAGQDAIGMGEGEQGDRCRYEKTDNQRQQTGHIDQDQQQAEHEQGPLISLRDAMALLQGLDRTEPTVDDQEARKEQHQHDDQAEHDKQRNTNRETALKAEDRNEGNAEQDGGHEYE